ncbi:MAG TPA: acyl-CoA dehydrogenase family protein, partial [Nocardioidaceae bacterium]
MTSDVNLLYTDVEDSLRSTVRDLLSSRCPAGSVTALYDGDRALVEPLWRSVAVDLGLAGLLVPEGLGGAGASAREAAVVLEELGRSVAPVPFLTSAVVATSVLAAGGSALLEQLASGERTAALVVPLTASPMAFSPTDVVAVDGRVSGTVTSVAGALEADVLLVPVGVERGVEVHAVAADAATITPVTSLDMTRQIADVSFDGAAADLVVEAAAGGAAVRDALLAGAALLASEQV